MAFLTDRDIPRWMRLAFPEDAQQEMVVIRLEHPDGLTPSAARALLRYRLAILRYEVWDREIRRRPRARANLRPSKLAKARGYRHDFARHSIARRRAYGST